MRFLLALFLYCSLFTFSAWAEINPPAGGEFNFSGPQLVHIPTGFQSIRNWLTTQYLDINHLEINAVNRFANELFAACRPHCQLEEFVRDYAHVPGAKCYRIRYNDGFFFEVMPDLYVVEVIHKPTTVTQLEFYEQRLQQVFDVARSHGLWTHSPVPGLPININHNFDMNQSFERSPRNFLHFFIDYANNLEMSHVVGSDYKYAPAFSELSPEAFAEMVALINRVNSAEIYDLAYLAREINQRVYTSTTYVTGGTSVPYYNQSFSLKHYSINSEYSEKPFELRSPRMPESAAEYILFLKLYVARMNYTHSLSQWGAPIIFLQRRQRNFSSQELVNRFFLYVTEAGLNWDEYKGLMIPSLQGREPDRFLTKNWRFNSAEIRMASAHIEFIATSPKVEQLFKDYILAHPNSELRSHIENEILAVARRHPEPQVRAKLLRFISAQSCPGTFR